MNPLSARMVTMVFCAIALVLFTIGFRLVKKGKTFSRHGGDKYTKRRVRRMLGWMLWTVSGVLVILAMINSIYSLAPTVTSVAQSGNGPQDTHVAPAAVSPMLMPNLLHAPQGVVDPSLTAHMPTMRRDDTGDGFSASGSHAPSLSPSLPNEPGEWDTSSHTASGADSGRPPPPPSDSLPVPVMDNSTPIAAGTPPAPVAQPPRTEMPAPDAAKRKQLDAELAALNATLQKDPQNMIAYIQRGNVYGNEKQWDLAKKDYQHALQINNKCVPAMFNLAELDFMQAKYEAARPGFLALENDSDFGDLSKYNVFLCDLFGGHEDAAAKELAVFNDVGSEASYYFANVAWSLYHKKTDANSWMQSAIRIFAPAKINLYAKPLIDLGYVSENMQ